jgi:hypothetical protein
MIKRSDNSKIATVLILFSIIFFSCGYAKKDAEKYLPGQYLYKIPSGEIQELKINPDFTFKQIIYSKGKKEVLYENSGRMYVHGDKIEFENWLECYVPADQKMLLKPYIAYSIGNHWIKPNGNESVLIVKFDETNYIFTKNTSN